MTVYTPRSLFQKQALEHGLGGKKYPAEQEFVDNGDGTVSDLSTGLMWAKDGNGAGCGGGVASHKDWADGIAYNLTLGGHDDWRIPTASEFLTLLKYNQSSPLIHPPFTNTKIADPYWTITGWYIEPGSFYCVDFQYGFMSTLDQGTFLYLRCVRTI